MTDFVQWRLELPADREDELTAELWRCGTLGLEVRPLATEQLLILAYFSDPEPPVEPPWDLEAWRQRGVKRLAVESFSEQDWMAAYRETIAPTRIGRFVVDAGEPGENPSPDLDAGADADSFLLRIPARSAFGTGSHESTRLTMAWLEDVPLQGKRILDVGTGSGILAFAALLLGAQSVVAYDIDAQAVCIAAGNRQLNAEVFAAHGLSGRAPLFLAASPDALRRQPIFDLALVNVLPERILASYPELLARLRQGGTVISSGNLVSQRDELLSRFAAWGLELMGEKVEGDWLALALRYSPPRPEDGS